MKEEIQFILKTIGKKNSDIKSFQEATYKDQKALISHLFSHGGDYSRGTIMLRLVVIDSLYSTNAAYSYFSFEEMAERIYELGHKEESAKNYFYSITKGGKDTSKLFQEAFGIQKNLSEGSKQMSLLSKYAYYSLFNDKNYPLGFPIYDRLALQMYPKVCRMLTIKPETKIDGSIETYVSALNEVRKSLFDNNELFCGLQQFDILDAYLWRMGKFSEGNMSLLLGREDYVRFVKNLNLAALPMPNSKDKFKEADKDYKLRMNKIHNGSLLGQKGKEFNFNSTIVNMFLDEKVNPFAGLNKDVADYMTTLLNHWRQLNKY